MIAVECMDAGAMWRRYEAAVGSEKLKLTFGDHWPPAGLRLGEVVYVWLEDGRPDPLAWLSLSRNQFDPSTAHMSRGVWPDCHGRGIGREMCAFAEAKCRESWPPINVLEISVACDNTQHLANVIADDYWTLSNVTFNPAMMSFAHEFSPAESNT